MTQPGDEIRHQNHLIRITGCNGRLIFTAFGPMRENGGRSFIGHHYDLPAARECINARRKAEAARHEYGLDQMRYAEQLRKENWEG